jgi:hypothetical protein
MWHAAPPDFARLHGLKLCWTPTQLSKAWEEVQAYRQKSSPTGAASGSIVYVRGLQRTSAATLVRTHCRMWRLLAKTFACRPEGSDYAGLLHTSKFPRPHLDRHGDAQGGGVAESRTATVHHHQPAPRAVTPPTRHTVRCRLLTATLSRFTGP